MTQIEQILIERDGLTQREASRLLETMKHRVSRGEDPEEVLYEQELELDYFEELLDDLVDEDAEPEEEEEDLHFTLREVEELHGQKVLLQEDVELPDVAPGTLGQVKGWQEAENGSYLIIVTFEPSLTNYSVPVWMNKTEYLYYTDEIQKGG